MDSIGSRLKAFAQHVGSMSKLAEMLDMKIQSLQVYMYDRSMPGTPLLQKLLNLGCNINWLISGKGEMLISEFEDNKTADAYSIAHKMDIMLNRFTEMENRLMKLERSESSASANPDKGPNAKKRVGSFV